MAQPILLQDRFTGMYRDKARDQLPAGKVWDMVDFIPEVIGAPIRRRGPWTYYGAALNTLNAAAGLPVSVHVAPFSAGTQVLATARDSGDDDLNLFDLTAGSDRGALFTLGSTDVAYPPAVFYRDTMIFPAYDPVLGPLAPRKYVAAGTLSNLGGSPPNCGCAAVYKDRLVVGQGGSAAAGSAATRLHFSGAGNAESWDTTLRYIDTSAPVVQLAPMKNALLVFHPGSVERIRGSIPPGSAASNMELEPLFGEVGLSDPRALAYTDEYCYWADEAGVYRTDGSSFTDLTKLGGISSYWRETMRNTMLAVSLAVWRGYVWVSLVGTSDTNWGFLVYDIEKRDWFRFSNTMGYNFATRSGATDELYFSSRDASAKKIASLSGVFRPAIASADDDGTNIQPRVELGHFDMGFKGNKRWRHIYLQYSMVSSGSPAFALEGTTDMLDTSNDLAYGQGTSFGTFTKTGTDSTDDVIARVRVPVARQSRGLTLIPQATGAMTDFTLWSIEADVYPKEGSGR